MEIVADKWPEDDQVGIGEVTIEYFQNPDCTEDADTIGAQTLTISTRDNGVARFINIKTDNWSIDGATSLVDIIKDFEKRASLLK